MLQYLVAGVVIGGIYAVAAAGLSATYVSSGILNFAYGAMAYFIGRTYYFLHTQHNSGILVSAIISILVVAPSMGLVLWAALFRFLKHSSVLIKVVATIGLAVTLPPLADICYGTPDITTAPGLAPLPVASYQVFGVAITLDQIIVLACVIGTLLAGYLIVRFTEWGLVARAIVDSPAVTALSGTNPSIMNAAMWSITTMLAGLIGVLVAPLIGLDASNYTLLVAAAFATIVVAQLSRIGVAVGTSIVLGLVTAICEYFLPPTSPITGGVIGSLPFAFILIYLLVRARQGPVADMAGTGGMLDRAIETKGDRDFTRHRLAAEATSAAQRRRLAAFDPRTLSAAVLLVGVSWAAFGLDSYWVGLIGEGLCFGVIFLSFTLVTGEGGMIWLCQVSFAGIGAVMTAHFAGVDHIPILLSIALATLLAVPGGIIVGLLTTRLGELYVALVTLSFGVLMDRLVFSLNAFSSYGTGIFVQRPGFLNGPIAFLFFVLCVFCVVGLVIETIRRSTLGLAVAAARWTEAGSAAAGLETVPVKVAIAGIAAGTASLGGGLLAVYLLQAQPTSFDTLGGLVWLAVLVTLGVRSNTAAALAGISFAVVPAIFQTYLPLSVAEVPTAVFGLGAILLARNPDGVVSMHARQLRGAITGISRVALSAVSGRVRAES